MSNHWSQPQNWRYEHNEYTDRPHLVAFYDCEQSGIHHRVWPNPRDPYRCEWHLTDDIVAWLNNFVGEDWTYHTNAPYQVEFQHVHHAILFKLTHCNGT